jgi:hypothetical protein
MPSTAVESARRQGRYPAGVTGDENGVTAFAVVFLVACALFFGYAGCTVLFDPHIVGFVGKTGHRVRATRRAATRLWRTS